MDLGVIGEYQYFLKTVIIVYGILGILFMVGVATAVFLWWKRQQNNNFHGIDLELMGNIELQKGNGGISDNDLKTIIMETNGEKGELKKKREEGNRKSCHNLCRTSF